MLSSYQLKMLMYYNRTFSTFLSKCFVHTPHTEVIQKQLISFVRISIIFSANVPQLYINFRLDSKFSVFSMKCFDTDSQQKIIENIHVIDIAAQQLVRNCALIYLHKNKVKNILWLVSKNIFYSRNRLRFTTLPHHKNFE